ncbi:MAG TPA: alkaline phosphatase family protein, partial [Vicinamibacteria bacterium]|nr:alkaline phosphatase family protein [Vicinamibacteria bacterium]
GFHPFLTGQDAARSGVLGLRWFDRSRARGNLRSYVGFTQDLINSDRGPRPLTLYERVGSQHTSSVNTYANRGVRLDVRVGWSFAMAKYRDVWGPARALGGIPALGRVLVPDWERAERKAVQAAIDDLQRRPKVQWITISSLDGHQHVHGTDARYTALLRSADAEIGRYRVASRRLGTEAQRIYAVLSDHGVEDARVNLDLRDVLASCCGLRAVRDQATRFRTSSLDVPLSDYAEADAVVVVNGNMLNYVYLRDRAAPEGGPWRQPLARAALSAYGPRRMDVVAGLLRAPGVELVIVRGAAPGQVEVYGAGGRGRAALQPGGIAYGHEGHDPLGYDALGLADGRPRTPARWL